MTEREVFSEGYEKAIKNVVPEGILDEAEDIVKAHRPTDPRLENFQPTAWGLKPKHHGELNKPGVSKKRLTELREQYKNDAVAQQQIDVYNGSTEYHTKFREFRNALKSGDEAKERKLSKWFKKHYPDI